MFVIKIINTHLSMKTVVMGEGKMVSFLNIFLDFQLFCVKKDVFCCCLFVCVCVCCTLVLGMM